MSKTLIAFLFSILLIFSIMAPVVVAYLDIQVDAISFGDFSDEEKKEKGEVDIQEKVLVDIKLHASERFILEEKNTLSFFYWGKLKSQSSKIFLPPPEYFI